jgi:hypothetical protein
MLRTDVERQKRWDVSITVVVTVYDVLMGPRYALLDVLTLMYKSHL